MAGGIAAGGQLTTTTDIENFPGFPEGISGPELMQRMRQQSVNCGADIRTETISKVNFNQKPFQLWREGDEAGEPILADSVIVSTGATARRPGLPGEIEYWQKGISACAVCDGGLPFFRNKPLAVIGGGDSATEEAGYLTKFGSKVYLIHRRDKLRASQIMVERTLKNPKIEMVWDSVPVEALGDGKLLTQLKIKNVKTNEEKILEVSGLFYAIGHKPNTEPFEKELDLDETGYIITKPNSTQTNIPGIFAAGDVQDKKYRQAITAAGSGCMAAIEVEHFLST